MDKKQKILDIYEELLLEGKGQSISIREIARRAGIAEGGLYYYFKNKDDLLDQVVERHFHRIIEQCQGVLHQYHLSSVQKIEQLFLGYTQQNVSKSISQVLHDPQNGYIHQKSQIYILTELSNLLSEIIIEGNQTNEFNCHQPLECAQIILSPIIFLLDRGLFQWSSFELRSRFNLCLRLFEQCCQLPENSIQIEFN